MKFEITVDDAKIARIVERTIEQEFHYDPPYKVNAMAKAVADLARQEADEQLKNYPIGEIVKTAFDKYAHGIIEEIVKTKLKELARKVVKELVDSGEVLP